MSEGPMTWDAHGNLVPLDAEEQERQNRIAQEEWAKSGSAEAKGPTVIPPSTSLSVGVIMRDVGELGVEAVKGAFGGTHFVGLGPIGCSMSLLVLVLRLTVGVVLFPLSWLLYRTGSKLVQKAIAAAVQPSGT